MPLHTTAILIHKHKNLTSYYLYYPNPNINKMLLNFVKVSHVSSVTQEGHAIFWNIVSFGIYLLNY